MNGLSNFEYIVLETLKANQGFVVKHHTLEDRLYELHDRNHIPRPESNVLEVIVSRVRRKGHPIKAVKGVGYVLQQKEVS